MSVKTKMLQLELQHSATGILPSPATPEEMAYSARLVEANARKAEAIAYAHPELDPLQRVRSFLKRGLLSESSEILRSLRETEVDRTVLIELLLECARLSFFKGDWETSLRTCDQVFAQQPSGVTQMTLRQVCANACLELGDLKRAQSEIEIASSLARLYPHASLALYVEATRIKILACMGALESATARLERCWQKMSSGPDRNIDNCVLLLRIEIELRRQSGIPYGPLAFANWILTRAVGDDVYAAMSVQEIHQSLPEERRAPWATELKDALGRFERLESEGTTFRSLQKTNIDVSFTAIPSSADRFTSLVLVSKNILIDLRDFSVQIVPMTAQFKSALKAIANGAIKRDRFFKAVWGDQKFSVDLHDSVIRRLLHRIRKSHPALAIQSESGVITLPGVLVVES